MDAASGVELTYRELEDRARVFAGRVRDAFGEGADVAVPVLAERSVDLVVAFTGILLAPPEQATRLTHRSSWSTPRTETIR
ncbi:hypothetical protein HC023_10470 [Streptomyces sp. NEAU-H3]|nr:hypothetical protein [Streptomyces sp. NEAU-H3]